MFSPNLKAALSIVFFFSDETRASGQVNILHLEGRDLILIMLILLWDMRID